MTETEQIVSSEYYTPDNDGVKPVVGEVVDPLQAIDYKLSLILEKLERIEYVYFPSSE